MRRACPPAYETNHRYSFKIISHFRSLRLQYTFYTYTYYWMRMRIRTMTRTTRMTTRMTHSILNTATVPMLSSLAAHQQKYMTMFQENLFIFKLNQFHNFNQLFLALNFWETRKVIFTESAPLGRFSHRVAMYVYLSVSLFAPLDAVFL